MVGGFINRAGDRVLNRIDIHNKRVLEIGPGAMEHIKAWRGKPAHYVIADIREPMLDQAAEKLEEQNIPYERILLTSRNVKPLCLENESFDIVLTFGTLEHLYPLNTSLEELMRVLKVGGYFAGGIPCEGGLGWGLGRFLTTRPLLKKKGINPDKIICWEHPNFADEMLNTMDTLMVQQYLSFWPFRIPIIDLNLIAKYIYIKGPQKNK